MVKLQVSTTHKNIRTVINEIDVTDKTVDQIKDIIMKLQEHIHCDCNLKRTE